MEIRAAEKDNLAELTALGMLLWPHHDARELEGEFGTVFAGGDARFFLAWEGARAVGFAQCQLRRDYVEGTESSPVGYLEGIFVREEFRHQGVATKLLNACEGWAVERGCQEFASDCELDNLDSLRFHLAMGFFGGKPHYLLHKTNLNEGGAAMNRQELIDACLALPGAYEDYPFAPNPGELPAAVMRHLGNRKSFAMIMEHGGQLYLNLKCPPAEADLLRQLFTGVVPGWHMNKVHWNSVIMDTDVPEEEIIRQIGVSYDLTRPKR